MLNQVAQRLVSLRGGRSQREIAKIAGVSENSYRKWEGGVNMIRPESAAKLAEYYGESLDYIYLGVRHNLSHLKNITEKEANTVLSALDRLAGESKDEYQRYVNEFKDILWDFY